jgi:hypothetical protein
MGAEQAAAAQHRRHRLRSLEGLAVKSARAALACSPRPIPVLASQTRGERAGDDSEPLVGGPAAPIDGLRPRRRSAARGLRRAWPVSRGGLGAGGPRARSLHRSSPLVRGEDRQRCRVARAARSESALYTRCARSGRVRTALVVAARVACRGRASRRAL